MSDFAGASLESLDANHFLNGVTLFARIQRSTALDIHGWELLGCPDMTPDNLLPLTRQLFADTAILCDGKGGLSPEELTGLEHKIPQIEQMLTRLSSSALPNTISNEDFKAGNVAVCGGEYVFYDWGNTVISHPMFGINYFLNRMIRPDAVDRLRWRNDLVDERRRELMSAFLSQWTDDAPWNQLLSEFWLCRRLYPLYEAVKCYCDIPFVGTTSPWGAGSLAFIPQAIRNLTVALDYQTETAPFVQ